MTPLKRAERLEMKKKETKNVRRNRKPDLKRETRGTFTPVQMIADG